MVIQERYYYENIILNYEYNFEKKYNIYIAFKQNEFLLFYSFCLLYKK